MALIKYSAVVGDASGKVGGNVFARNKGGAYVRTYTKPINPGTPKQSDVRSLFSNANADWRNLTDAERAGWNALADGQTFKNRLGDDIKLSGIALFIKASQNVKNANRLISTAISSIASPPADVLAPAMPESFTIDAEYNTGVFSLVVDAPDEGDVPTPVAFVVEATPALPPSKNNAQLEFRYLKSFAGDDSWSGEALTTEYVAEFGEPAVGSVIQVRAKAVSNSNGIASDYLLAKAAIVISNP